MSNSEKEAIQDSEILNHYVNEWTMLNQYVNDLDRGYEKFLTLIALIAGGTVTLLTFISDGKHGDYAFVFYIVPLAFLAVFGVLSYQFRITAILRGHLARVEDEMNAILNAKVYMWNSALVEVYMAHNNVPNNFLMVPIMLFIIGIIIVCVIQTVITGDAIFNIAYWAVVLGIAIAVLIPFLRNEIFRHDTYDTDKVSQKYERYKVEYKEKQTKAKRVKLERILSILQPQKDLYLTREEKE